MEIIYEKPPFLDKILKAGMKPNINSTVFTYGNKLYVPGKGYIPDHLMIHEQTHTVQQGDDPDTWWDRYLIDTEWRFDQELEAYHNQYVFYCKTHKSRNDRFNFLTDIARMLASPMYGIDITPWEASQRIKNFNKLQYVTT